MTRHEWAKRNGKAIDRLLEEEKHPATQRERDIWNLKYILYGIGKDSLLYRMGCVKTLRRAIKILEREEQPKV